MKFGLELVTTREFHLKAGDFIEVAVLLDARPLPATAGRDHYALNLCLPPGSRLAATGRLNLVATDYTALGLRRTQARPAWVVPFPHDADGRMAVRVRSNFLLDPAQVRAGLCLRALVQCAQCRAVAEWPLRTVEVYAESGYTYIVLPRLPAVARC